MTEQKKHIEDQRPKSNFFQNIRKHPMFTEIIVLAIIVLIAASIAIYSDVSSKINVDKAEIYAPTISIAPTSPGILEKVYVSEGDLVGKRKVVATVGGKSLQTQTGGLITSVNNIPGAVVTSATPIVEMINPDDMHLIGHMDEDKGLSEVKVGQAVRFTVDAFGSKKYYGTVDEISPSARQHDIVFSISDKREVRQFDIKVKFDVDKYPELRNGMSAKMTIYKYE